MKVLKIVSGLFLIFGSGAEYINASKELLTFLDPSIIFASLTMIFISAFLIANGVSKEKVIVRSWKFALYYIISIFMFLLVAFVFLLTFKFEPEIVNVNGVSVDIAQFMNGSKKTIPDENERRNYCICVVTKLTRVNEIVDEYSLELKQGKIDKIFDKIKSTKYISELNFNECMNSIQNFKWTTEAENGLRKNLMIQLEHSEYKKTNDINKYCDCLVEEYVRLPVDKFSSSDFYETNTNYKIDSICKIKSKLK